MTLNKLMNSGMGEQVMFYDGDGMCSGIMVGDKIVCGCCGAIFEVSDILEYAKDDGIDEPIRAFAHWADISDEIKGDMAYRTFMRLKTEEQE